MQSQHKASGGEVLVFDEVLHARRTVLTHFQGSPKAILVSTKKASARKPVFPAAPGGHVRGICSVWFDYRKVACEDVLVDQVANRGSCTDFK